MTRLFAAAYILALVAGSATIEDMNDALAITDVKSVAQLFQQQLLMGGEHVKRIGHHNFADQLMQSSRRRRTAAVECALDPGVVDLFDITASITPQNLLTQSCRLADQLLLGQHDIYTILLN